MCSNTFAGDKYFYCYQYGNHCCSPIAAKEIAIVTGTEPMRTVLSNPPNVHRTGYLCKLVLNGEY